MSSLAPEVSSGGHNSKPEKTVPLSRGDGSRRSKRVGRHRKEDPSGNIFFKKAPQDHISGALQLGITHSVGAHQVDRDVLLQDFEVIEQISFPERGTTLTPNHNFGDFKFKSYAPIAFRYFRDIFEISTEDFLHSVGGQPMIPIGNPGASGSCFWITHDDEFIVKTVQQKEANFLQKLLPGYYMNLDQNPRTLLPKFYGLYCINIGGRNIRVVIMNNLLPRKVKMHQKFDLKGSTAGRKAGKKEREKSNPTFKDLDFLSLCPEGIRLDFEVYEALKETIKRDVLVLRSFKIMDYSLLLGVHNCTQAEQEKQQKSPDDAKSSESINPSESSSSNVTLRRNSKARNRKKHISLNPTALDNILSKSRRPDRLLLATDQWGGIPASNQNGDKLNLYLGLIDILQCYKTMKRVEHAWKSIIYDGDTVSVHRPGFYSERFEKFLFQKTFTRLPMTESLRRLNEKAKTGRARSKIRIPTKAIRESENEEVTDGVIAVEELQAQVAQELFDQVNSIDRQKTFRGTKAKSELLIVTNDKIPIPRDLTDRASGDIEKSSDENSDGEKPDLKENGDQHCPATEPILDDQKVQSKSVQIVHKSASESGALTSGHVTTDVSSKVTPSKVSTEQIEVELS